MSVQVATSPTAAAAASSSSVGLSAKNPRTSLTHPINISWLFNEQDRLCLPGSTRADDPLPAKKRKHSLPLQLPSSVLSTATLYNPSKRIEMEREESATTPRIFQQGPAASSAAATSFIIHGIPPPHITTLPINFALSSCPGKKVRLDHPETKLPTKAIISRDLRLDLIRIKQSGVATILCLLDDAELSLIGVSAKTYVAEAENLGIRLIRYPIVEGKAPSSPSSVYSLLSPLILISSTSHSKEKTNRTNTNNNHILCHCRGGIGRAGVLAVCFMLMQGVYTSVEEAVVHLRERRSRKAIETAEQMKFLHLFLEFLQVGGGRRRRDDVEVETKV